MAKRTSKRKEGKTTRPRKMYIDVDGVLVTWDRTHNCVELSRGFGRLMRFCKIHNIQPYWLTTWHKKPTTLEGLNCLLWPVSCQTMAVPQIATYGEKGKTEGIDYESDFVWIEDGISPEDMKVLEDRGVADRFFWTEGLDPHCLTKFMEFTRKKMKLPKVKDWGPKWDSFFSRPRKRPRK
jgi:hypothetical protein